MTQHELLTVIFEIDSWYSQPVITIVHGKIWHCILHTFPHEGEFRLQPAEPRGRWEDERGLRYVKQQPSTSYIIEAEEI
jgi:hypothetical protein